MFRASVASNTRPSIKRSGSRPYHTPAPRQLAKALQSEGHSRIRAGRIGSTQTVLVALRWTLLTTHQVLLLQGICMREMLVLLN